MGERKPTDIGLALHDHVVRTAHSSVGPRPRISKSSAKKMSDVEISARIIEQSPTSFLVMVTSAAASDGDEDSAADLRTAEARTRREAERMRDALIGQTVEAIERRGHNVVRVKRTAVRQASARTD